MNWSSLSFWQVIGSLILTAGLLLLGLPPCRGAGPDSEAAETPPPKETVLEVVPLPESVRQEFGLDPFYRKYVSAGGLPVISSEKPSDLALLEAAFVVNTMLSHREEIRRAMIKDKRRVAVMAYTEFTTDIPEHSHMQPKQYADKRARGMGGHTVSCAEENMLSYPGDPYAKENILIHEFAHGIHSTLRSIDPEFNRRLREAYDKAMEAGLWKGKYAATNPGEYWAEAVQSWFDTNRENDGSHNHVDTREELIEYDPAVAKLVEEVFGSEAWRYTRATERLEMAHLKGYDPSRAPTFSWPKELIEWNRAHAGEVRRQRRARRNLERLTLSPVAADSPLPVSKESDQEVTILFINRTGHDVTLSSIGTDGKRTVVGELEARQRVEHKTFAGRVWLVSGPDDQPMATVVAAEKPGRAVIRDRGGSRD